MADEDDEAAGAWSAGKGLTALGAGGSVLEEDEDAASATRSHTCRDDLREVVECFASRTRPEVMAA